MACQETLTEFTPGSAATAVTGSGQTTTNADGLGLGLALGLGVTLGLGLELGDGLADGLELALGDGLADANSLADGLALLLGSGDDAVADGDDEFETCGEGSVVVVGSSVSVRAVRAVIVSDVDADGELLDDGEALGEVDADGDGDALASFSVQSSVDSGALGVWLGVACSCPSSTGTTQRS